jgi:alpha-ribazole phosphatase CobZ
VLFKNNFMEIEKEEGYIAVYGDFKVLSSAVYNGGFVKARTIINLKVSEGFQGDAFEVFDSFIKEKDLERKGVVGMMTAVPMENAVIMKKEDVTAIITAGISKSSSKSTINIILLTKNNLSQSAMANTIIVATEAKTAALFDLDVHDEQGDLFTGDSTDSVVVASYGEEGAKEEVFAGKATRLGSAVYEVVREGVKEALFRHNGLKVDRPILRRLEERGISLGDMVSTALELYTPVEGEAGVGEEELKRRLEATIKKECSDVNVALLLAAALHSDEEEISNGRAGKAGEEDAACIVADELIGIDIAEYIGGKKALFNFFYYDTRKPGILSQLDVFMDDAIGGLIAGCMSKMLD